MPATVLHCGCDGKPGGAGYQDAAYGHGVRVHNATAKDNPRVWRCSACGKERQSGKDDKKK